MKIIEHGKYRVVDCGNYGCKFSFELNETEIEKESDINPIYDLLEYSIRCLECNMSIP